MSTIHYDRPITNDKSNDWCVCVFGGQSVVWYSQCLADGHCWAGLYSRLHAAGHIFVALHPREDEREYHSPLCCVQHETLVKSGQSLHSYQCSIAVTIVKDVLVVVFHLNIFFFKEKQNIWPVVCKSALLEKHLGRLVVA